MEGLIKLEDGTTFEATAKGRMELDAYLIAGLRQGENPPSFPNIAEWLLPLGIGREFVGQPLPDDFGQMEPQMCFSNAFAIATFNSGVSYCEGFLFRAGMIPLLIHHAWCLRGEELIEPTINEPNEGDSYYGIVFPDFSDVTKVVNDTRTYSVIFKKEGEALIERLAEEARNG